MTSKIKMTTIWQTLKWATTLVRVESDDDDADDDEIII